MYRRQHRFEQELPHHCWDNIGMLLGQFQLKTLLAPMHLHVVAKAVCFIVPLAPTINDIILAKTLNILHSGSKKEGASEVETIYFLQGKRSGTVICE